MIFFDLLKEVKFSNEQIILFLEKNDFKVETHGGWKYAIPTSEEWDREKHSPFKTVFMELVRNKISYLVLNMLS